MKILLIPLDERPCNVKYPQMIAKLQPQLQLVVPPLTMLGQKKQPADRDRLWAGVAEQAPSCQLAIFSIETLVYGGLIPSRLHHDSGEQLKGRLDRIRQLKKHHPQLEIFASSVVMRTPTYSSSEEEPDYYEDFGAEIFQWGWLQDQAHRKGLNPAEQEKLRQIEQRLPPAHLTDYRTRREKNLAVNKAVIDLVEEGVISFLSMPQDDSGKYGFTALDQQQLTSQIISLRLQQRVHLYAGSDEVGCTLLARAFGHLTGIRRTFYLLYSSVYSEQVVPMYEDRPVGESVKAQILAAGGQVVIDPEAADCILAVNTAGQVVQEAWDQPIKDITYSSFRNLRFFVDRIGQFLVAGKKVAIADVAFANGGETELVHLLDDRVVNGNAAWDAVLTYAGWNTCCNTMGTVLATAILGTSSNDIQRLQFLKIFHLLEDWAYQAVIRMDMVKHYLPTLGASYYDFNGQEETINREMADRMLALWYETFRRSFTHWEIEQLEVFSPWHRMFEIGLRLSIQSK